MRPAGIAARLTADQAEQQLRARWRPLANHLSVPIIATCGVADSRAASPQP
jgi:hypothetical protein